MSAFKDLVFEDIHKIFLNADEFAETRTVLYDGKAFPNIPIVLSQIKEKDRHQSSSDHAQGLYMVQYTMHAALDDLGGVLPEKGMKIRINDKELGRPKPSQCCPYLYELRYADFGYDKAAKYYERYKPSYGSCSVVSRGHVVGRNFDYPYDELASFAVHTEATSGRHAVLGVARGNAQLTNDFVLSGSDSDAYDLIPCMLLDGFNDAGLFAEINVTPTGDYGLTSGTNPAGKDLCTAMVVRYVLDNAASVDEAIALLRTRNIFAANSSVMKQEFHFLLKDLKKTAVIEFINNQMWVIESFVNGKEIMTNFYLYGYDGTRQSLTPHAMGIERYDILAAGYNGAVSVPRMIELMKSVRYSKAYSPDENPVWLSEFAGEYSFGALTKDSPAEDYDGVLAHVRGLFQNRSRATGDTWHTVHTSVYDLETKRLIVIPQEGDDAFTFKLDDGGIAKDRNAGFFRTFHIVTSGIEMGMVRLELEAIDE